jgi:hypothetical protein
MTQTSLMQADWLAIVLTVVLIGGSIWLAAASNLLRDHSTAMRRPFSYSRVQFLWWMLIIAFCFLRHYGATFELPDINATCLVLMGIGVGTTTVASVIDARQRRVAVSQGLEVAQDRESQGFFEDILSDDNGLSVHRLQAFIFNVIYGVAFYTTFVRTGQFEEYGQLQYAVIGISSVGYLGLKALENNPQNQAPGAGRAGGDELVDADPAPTGPGAVG